MGQHEGGGGSKPKKAKTCRLFRGKAPHLSTSKTNALSLPQEFTPTTAGGKSGKILRQHTRASAAQPSRKKIPTHTPDRKESAAKKEEKSNP